MKKLSYYRSSILLSSLFTLSAAGALPANAQQWKPIILPADANQDRVVKLVANHTQMFTFTLQADQGVTGRGPSQKIVLEFDLPTGFNIVHQSGYFKLTEIERKVVDRRTVVRYDAVIDNGHILGTPGARVASEWQLHSFFLNTPSSIAAGQDYVRVNVIDGATPQSFNWPLQMETVTPPRQRAKRTPIALWSYNYQRATNEAASEGIAKFFHDSGVTFVQAADDPTYHKALKKHGVLTGGNTHHDYFTDPKHPLVEANGNVHAQGFPEPHGIATLPAGAEIAGVDRLIKHARDGDGIAAYDYEPKGTIGFSDGAIKTFKEKYTVGDADFKTFRDYVAKNGLQTHLSTDPLISKLWVQWTEFASDQTSNYTRRIYEAVKAKAPDVTVAVTPSLSYGQGTKSSIALGTDNAAMAQYSDIILPQIYCGYGAAAAKLAMRITAGWRGEIAKQNAKTQLWPLLLVRYAGASPSNSPQRLYQQSIGAMANGADGVAYYYPDNMDAPYWSMVSKLNADLAKYEDFYHDGKRVDERFPLSLLPRGNTEVNMYPGYPEPVENPGWSFTAHEVGNKILLTLINLEEANDLVFGIDVGNVKYVSGENVEAITGKLSETLEEQIIPITGVNQWLVGPGQVGYIVLEKN